MLLNCTDVDFRDIYIRSKWVKYSRSKVEIAIPYRMTAHSTQK